MSAELLPLIAAEPAPPAAPGKPTCGELTSANGVRLPLRALRVETAVVGLTATATVRQRFVNAGDATIEATYVFPLPSRAGVTDFEASLAGRRVIGVLKERGQARVDYEQALVAGQRAAIAEEDRPDVFSVRVGNLGPGEEATIEMRLTGPLAFEDGEATFRFPLVVAPRYTTGTPLPGDQTGAGFAADTDAVPDASRVTPPRLADQDDRPDLQISLTVDGGGLGVSDLRASLPTGVTESDGLTLLRVEPGARADRDFVLRFRVDRRELSSCALLVPDGPDIEGPGASEGTWSVTLVPPAETSSTPRDVVVLLDRSGSMQGWKMVAARRAAGRIVDMLDPADRFCVLAFDDRIDSPPAMPEGLVEASDRNRFAAASWLGSLESRGGTEMANPLRKAVEMLAATAADRLASVVLVTDGQITGEDHALKSLAPLIGRTRTYCVGIDRAVNAGFLERLAGLGSGRAELVESEERLDESMARLARTIGRPSLTGIQVSAEGVEIIEGTVTPARLPDAFAGVPCVISGRYRSRSADADADADPQGRSTSRPAPRPGCSPRFCPPGRCLPRRPCGRSGRARWSVTWRTRTRPAPVTRSCRPGWSRTPSGSGCCRGLPRSWPSTRNAPRLARSSRSSSPSRCPPGGGPRVPWPPRHRWRPQGSQPWEGWLLAPPSPLPLCGRGDRSRSCSSRWRRECRFGARDWTGCWRSWPRIAARRTIPACAPHWTGCAWCYRASCKTRLRHTLRRCCWPSKRSTGSWPPAKDRAPNGDSGRSRRCRRLALNRRLNPGSRPPRHVAWRLEPLAGFGEHGAQDRLDGVELGLTADQRRSQLDDGIATVVGAAIQPGRKERR